MSTFFLIINQITITIDTSENTYSTTLMFTYYLLLSYFNKLKFNIYIHS